MKITIDLNSLRNTVTQIKNEAYDGLVSNNDMKRRDTLSKVVERLKDLQGHLSEEQVKIEVK